jgi:hypothetical protein
MKRISIILLVLLAIGSEGYSQRWRLHRYRLFFGVSSSNYFGDMGGAISESNWFGIKDLDINMSRPVFHVGALYKLTDIIDVKLNFNYGYISGSDANSKLEKRNFSFKSYIFEPSVQGMYTFYSSSAGGGSGRIFSRRGMLNNYSKINLYVFGGMGMVMFNPEVPQTQKVIERASEFSLGKKITLVAPVGVGAYYILNSKWEVGFEVGGRFALTDYLDGFSSRWSKGVNDVYYLTQISAIYRIKTARNGWPEFKLFGRKY